MATAENRRKRANKRQQEHLVERLHNNMEIVRGNQADSRSREMWEALSTELNQMGCSRTLEQWQHIWSVWVGKIKTKARKVRDDIQATGGGPAGAGLTEVEMKILDIIGSASVYGFVQMEQGLPPTNTSPPPILQLQRLDNEQEPAEEAKPQEVPQPRRRRRVRPRRRPQPSVSGILLEAMNENERLMRETITQAAETIAAAIVSAASQNLNNL